MQLGSLLNITANGGILITPTMILIEANYNLKSELSNDIPNQPLKGISAQRMWCHAEFEPGSF